MGVLPLSPEDRYTWKRRAEAWKFGAGLDYKLNFPKRRPKRAPKPASSKGAAKKKKSSSKRRG